MTHYPKPPIALHIALWVAQILIAASFSWAAYLKLFQPIAELSRMWPWTAQIPPELVKLTGVFDFLGAVGILLPSLLRIRPGLTPITAIAIVVQMICAGIFHISRGEAAGIAPNIVFALLAAFVAWGRSRKAPIPAR
ncbi:DoxX family protein [Larkinella terrae]|uniref:DoxX family protein n=1 Tax=Larkinella terrae TaxID=2025311 RepID=A0A7K0EN03_9BACT|nr:DoxX family protein [Larkinella terrae]MRS62818.1 DoxX family protein [Larkinella terrae]